MKPYLLTLFVAVAYARPEAPLPQGYNYPSPNLGSIDFGGSQQPGPHQAINFGGLQNPAGDFGSIGGAPQGGPIGSDFGGHAGGGLDNTYGAPAQGQTVHKHVYVHVAPEEPEEHRAPKVIPTSAPQKHYKIIFIKAPNPPTPTAPIIPAQPQDEEKTLVYVLVKKPEEQPEIVVPTPAPTQPSKPEVYFIRYKTQKDGANGGYSYAAPAGPGASGSGAGISGAGGDLSGAGGSIGGGSIGGGSIGGGAASSQYGPPGYHK